MDEDLDNLLDYEEEDAEESQASVPPPTFASTAKRPRTHTPSTDPPKTAKRPRLPVQTQTQAQVKFCKHVPKFSPINTSAGGRGGVGTKSEGKPAHLKSLSLLLCDLPSGVAKQAKVRQEMARFGEVASVEVFAEEKKAVVRYLTTSGANRAFNSSAPVFRNSAIHVYRIPDCAPNKRKEAEAEAVPAPNRSFKKLAVGSDSATSSASSSVKASSSIKANRSWSRPGTVKRQALLTAKDQQEITRARLKEKLAYKELAVAKKKLTLVGKELVAHKRKLNELSASKKPVSSQEKQQVLNHITSLMMQLKNAETAVKKANKSVEFGSKAMNEWRQKLAGNPQKNADADKPKSSPSPSPAQLSNLQQQLLKLKETRK